MTQYVFEELILHDRILIPTNDFLTACGLIRIVGERGFIEMLERGRVDFIRTRGIIGYMHGERGTGCVVGMADPEARRAQDCPVDESIAMGLSVLPNLAERAKLKGLLTEHTKDVSTSTIVLATWQEAFADFRISALWKPSFETSHPGDLALPGMEKMGVRVFTAASSPNLDPVDALLALVHHNVDLYLANTFQCENSSPFFPIRELLDLKQRRLRRAGVKCDGLRSLLKVDGVPDISKLDLSEGTLLSKLLQITSEGKIDAFREWFHRQPASSPDELLREYVEILRSVPGIQSVPAKSIRLVLTSIAGLAPWFGIVASIFDQFVVESLFSESSPRVFLDALADIVRESRYKKR